MKLLLKQATKGDIQTVLNILNAGTRNKMRRGDFAWGMSDHNPETISDMITRGQYYLAYNDAIPVGTLAVTWDDAHVWGAQHTPAGYVQRFTVAPGYNGQNVGGQIVELALEEVAAHGGHYLRIAVPSENMKLRSYYEKQGFTRADSKVTLTARPASAATYYERPTTRLVTGSDTPNPKTNLFSKLLHRDS